MSAIPASIRDGLAGCEIARGGGRRKVEWVVASYSRWYNPFAELLDNALDAIARRRA